MFDSAKAVRPCNPKRQRGRMLLFAMNSEFFEALALADASGYMAQMEHGARTGALPEKGFW